MIIETIVFYTILFISGLLIGSFLNVVADRSVNGGDIWFGRSECDHCKKLLGAKELIPLFSFLFQKGKCSNCKKQLSYYYPFSELATGLIFVTLGYWLGLNFYAPLNLWIVFFYYIIVACIFNIILFSDLKYFIVPDKVVLPGIAFVLIARLTVAFYSVYIYHKTLSSTVFGQYLIKAGMLNNHVRYLTYEFAWIFGGALLIGLFFLFLIALTKGRGMGGGDVKLGFMIGLFNGFPGGIIAIFLGFLTGSLYSVILILSRKKGMKDAIAFGPFLILGSYLSLFFGQALLDWYLNLF